MNLKEKISFLFESHDKSYEKMFVKLKDYNDVEGMEEFINLISNMYENNYLVTYFNIIKDLNEYEDLKNNIYNAGNDFIKMANKYLESHRCLLLFPKRNFITLTTVDAVLNIVQFNFYFHSDGNIESLKKINEIVYNGNIISYLTFNVDDFKEAFQIHDYSEKFFQNLSNIKFDTIRSEHLHHDIWDYLFIVLSKGTDYQLFNNTICICAEYLMACNALKNNRDSICCEDVIIGYRLTLSLLTEDIREYVIKYYDDDLKISDFIAATQEDKIPDGVGFKGAISLIFAFLMFLEIIFLIIYLKDFLVPQFQFTDIPFSRLVVLGISIYVSGKFYNYLAEGSDINLFEDGKSKVMILFIIIFIITVIIGFI